MNRRGERELEKHILSLTDDLIEKVISLGVLNEDQHGREFANAVELAREVCTDLAQLMRGQEGYLEDALMELALQRLPDRNILASFSNFSSELEGILGEGFKAYKGKNENDGNSSVLEEDVPCQEPAELDEMPPEPQQEMPEIVCEDEPDPVATKEKICRDPVLEALNILFPGREVHRGFFIHGIRLSYYLPAEKIAVQVGKIGSERNAYFLRCEGIRVLEVTPVDAGNARRLGREIRRQLVANGLVSGY